MKILWFANTPCGATEKLTGNKVTGGGWLYALSEGLKDYKDIDLHIAFYWGKAMDAFAIDGITYHPVLRDGDGSKFGRYIHRLKAQYSFRINDVEVDRVEAVIRQVNPDLIHFHGSEENFGLVAERIAGIPMVLSIQGLLSPFFYKLYSGYQKADVVKGERLITKILHDGWGGGERRMKRNTFREQKIFKSITNIIGRTSWDRDCSLALNPNRRYFVCNEILRPEFMNGQWSAPSTNKIILATTVSNGLWKGLEMIYNTASILAIQNIDFEWNVIGIASGASMESITRRITGVNPASVNINLLGRKNASEMIEFLNRSNAFIQVSHIENSPNSLCEAMVLGMPIIASYAGGTSSMLEDGKEGVLVQDGDPYRLAGAIINLRNDYSHALEMGQAARTRALVRHNPENVVNELLNVYNTLYNE